VEKPLNQAGYFFMN